MALRTTVTISSTLVCSVLLNQIAQLKIIGNCSKIILLHLVTGPFMAVASHEWITLFPRMDSKYNIGKCTFVRSVPFNL